MVGNEAYVARQVKAEATHSMTVRYLGAGVTLNPTDRWILDGRPFGIVEVRNVEERNRHTDDRQGNPGHGEGLSRWAATSSIA